MMSLRALIEKAPDADLLREIFGFAAQRLMELGVRELAGAACGEKSVERLAQRNGYRDRDWETRAGTIKLRIPGEASITRLIGAVLLEANDEWQLQHRWDCPSV
jgi:transposase-like protein